MHGGGLAKVAPSGGAPLYDTNTFRPKASSAGTVPNNVLGRSSPYSAGRAEDKRASPTLRINGRFPEAKPQEGDEPLNTQGQGQGQVQGQGQNQGQRQGQGQGVPLGYNQGQGQVQGQAQGNLSQTQGYNRQAGSYNDGQSHGQSQTGSHGQGHGRTQSYSNQAQSYGGGLYRPTATRRAGGAKSNWPAATRGGRPCYGDAGWQHPISGAGFCPEDEQRLGVGKHEILTCAVRARCGRF